MIASSDKRHLNHNRKLQSSTPRVLPLSSSVHLSWMIQTLCREPKKKHEEHLCEALYGLCDFKKMFKFASFCFSPLKCGVWAELSQSNGMNRFGYMKCYPCNTFEDTGLSKEWNKGWCIPTMPVSWSLWGAIRNYAYSAQTYRVPIGHREWIQADEPINSWWHLQDLVWFKGSLSATNFLLILRLRNKWTVSSPSHYLVIVYNPRNILQRALPTSWTFLISPGGNASRSMLQRYQAGDHSSSVLSLKWSCHPGRKC